MDPVEDGRYAALVEDVKDESIVATVQAEKDGIFLGEKTVAINLTPVRGEMDNIETDRRFLFSLAKKLDAEYFDLDEIDKNVAKMFAPSTKVSNINSVRSTWPRWSLLLVLCGLLSVNWFARRAMGLL